LDPVDHLAEVPGILDHVLLGVEPGHLGVHDRNADCILTARNIAVEHGSLLIRGDRLGTNAVLLERAWELESTRQGRRPQVRIRPGCSWKRCEMLRTNWDNSKGGLERESQWRT